MTNSVSATPPKRVSFAAMARPAYRLQFICYVTAMMADSIEHVISYWYLFQKFQSPALGGFAILSHWLPPLLFSVSVGSLAERRDIRRIIQCGMALFMCASASWAFFFVTDTLTVWSAMVILIIHGFAGLLWQTPNQLLLYSLVEVDELPSAIRLNAMARYVGFLVGPAVGGLIMILLGPIYGIVLNTLFYLPMMLWLIRAPGRSDHPTARAPMRGFADIVETIKIIAPSRILSSMTLLAGITSFLIGNAYSPQMPGFAANLGHGNAGVLYSLLLAADAAGAMTAGVLLEAWGRLRPTPKAAIGLAALWACSLIAFACSGTFVGAVLALFAAGFCELSFNTIAQALVQLNAPPHAKGRVIGLYNVGSLGMRAFSGLSVGVLGAWIGIHWSLALSAFAVLSSLLYLHVAYREPGSKRVEGGLAS
jgi:MFS family permease